MPTHVLPCSAKEQPCRCQQAVPNNGGVNGEGGGMGKKRKHLLYGPGGEQGAAVKAPKVVPRTRVRMGIKGLWGKEGGKEGAKGRGVGK